MVKITLNRVLVIVLIFISYIGGFYSSSEARYLQHRHHQSQLYDAIIMDALFIRSDNDALIRLAFMEFLMLDGRYPARNTSSGLLLSHLQKRLTKKEIGIYFDNEFNSIDSIQKENCMFKVSKKVVFSINGNTKLVKQDYRGKINCEEQIKKIELAFSNYVSSYEYRSE